MHAVRCLANLSEPFDNRELVGGTEAALETLLLAVGSSNDTLATTGAFALAKLTEGVAANVVALGGTFRAVEKLTECVVRGSRRARSNAAVCVCHLTARRHGLSVQVDCDLYLCLCVCRCIYIRVCVCVPPDGAAPRALGPGGEDAGDGAGVGGGGGGGGAGGGGCARARLRRRAVCRGREPC